MAISMPTAEQFMAAPISTFTGIVDSNLASTIGTVSGAVSGTIAPLAATCFGIYIILVVVNYMRGADSSPVWDVWIRALSFAIIISVGLNSHNYTTYIVPIVTGIGDDLANAAAPGGGADSSLDTLLKHYLKIIQEDQARIQKLGFWDGSDNIIQPLLWLIKSAIILIGLLPFVIVAALLLIVVKVGVTLVTAVGPLFFCFLMFPATRQYFSSWCNAVLSYALIPLFIAVVVAFSINVSMAVFGGSVEGGTVLEKTSFTACFIAAVINLLLLFVVKYIVTLASTLSAGGINVGFSAGGVGNFLKDLLPRPSGNKSNAKSPSAQQKDGGSISKGKGDPVKSTKPG
jgi:type IV secretion system protein VirB6